jgi:hypothetical protein
MARRELGESAPLSTTHHLLFSSLCKEGRQNADRRRTNRRAYGRGARSAERARLSAFHRGSCVGERTPPLSSSRASWDAALTGVTRLPPIPVQRAPRRPVIVPAGRCPEPPGSGLQIRPREPHPLHLTACLRKASLGERDLIPSHKLGRMSSDVSLVLTLWDQKPKSISSWDENDAQSLASQ